MSIDVSEIPSFRLKNQQLTEQLYDTPQELLNNMGAMQAQDFNMIRWAVGRRLKKANEQTVVDALNDGTILRTHLLRPTWHLVSSDDIYWMLKLTGPRIKTSLKSRHKSLEIDDKVITMSYRVIEKALVDRESITRDELVSEFKNAGLKVSENRASHLLLVAELDGVICSGDVNGNKMHYSLLSKRVPDRNEPDHNESIALLTRKYFFCRAPATLSDFVWWSGLKISDAKKGLEINHEVLRKEIIQGEDYWVPSSFSSKPDESGQVILLPSYDEYIIAYKFRDLIIPAESKSRSMSSNGIFWPVILVNGKVTGTWKRAFKKEHVIVEPVFFRNHTHKEIELIEQEVEKYSKFLRMKTLLKIR